MVTDISTLNFEASYSYADYLKWTFDEKVELIKGRILKMSPAPLRKHQMVSSGLLKQIFRCENLKACQVYHAPFDVRLLDKKKSTTDKEIFTVVQPDISIICDESKLDERGCLGAPDCIIEVASKSTIQKDIKVKFDLYEENEVREYWIVFPNEKAVLVYDLDENCTYRPRFMDEDQRFINLKVLGDFQIDLDEVFQSQSRED
ncbi:MAG: Uma2 family endonuclease [Bacteroidales bacterium]|nr:Uma2 family endonuclease [Bacteroidales bacterium]MCF8457514.1 Uma2 family endonuclease [Bacteroidales bacterium]